MNHNSFKLKRWLQHFPRSVTESELQPLAINKMHSWIIHVVDSDGEAISNAQLVVTGGMPQHNHGLPTLPAVTASPTDGDYQIEGMRFHMRGYWEIRVSIDTGTERDDVTIALTL